jgi:hypothetical protein
MTNNENNIWPNGSEKEQNLADLHNDLFSEDDNFEQDAAEGLQHMPQQKVDGIVQHLNGYLQQKITRQRPKRRLEINLRQSIIAIVVILILAVLAFAVLHKLKR